MPVRAFLVVQCLPQLFVGDLSRNPYPALSALKSRDRRPLIVLLALCSLISLFSETQLCCYKGSTALNLLQRSSPGQAMAQFTFDLSLLPESRASTLTPVIPYYLLLLTGRKP